MASVVENGDRNKTSIPGLKGQFLVAMPGMDDGRFERSVIFMIDHDSTGAMGVVINDPLHAIDFVDLLGQLDIDVTEDIGEHTILLGGPVDLGRGFVLHSSDISLDDTIHFDQIAMTASLDMLAKIADGSGPEHTQFALGYAGWDAGQLDQEMKNNLWLSVPAHADIIFHTPLSNRWERTMELAGIKISQLSAQSGKA